MTQTVEIESEDLVRMVLLLDAAQDALDAAATRERKREEGKAMRQITEQQRATATREHVAKIKKQFGIDLS